MTFITFPTQKAAVGFLPSSVYNKATEELEITKKIKDINDYPYTPKEWMVKYLKIDPAYVDQMFDFFKKTLVTFYMEKSEKPETKYREYVKLCVTDKLRISEHGLSYNLENPNEVDDYNNYSSKNMSGFLRYMILHYEEDRMVDIISKKYNLENNAINTVLQLKNYKKEITRKSFFELLENYIDDNENTNSSNDVGQYRAFNIVETIFSYNYHKKCNFLCVGERDSAYFMCKCSTNLDNPALNYIQHKFDNGNFAVNIINGNIKIATNLNGVDLLLIQNGSWILP